MKIAGRGMVGGIFKWFGTDPTAIPCTSHNATQPAGSQCAYGRPSQDFGTTSVGTERGPGFQNYDMSISKGFKTFKEETLKARVDAFNAFNIASYGEPNTYLGGSTTTFGQILGTASAARKFQLSLVYQF
jgi:hypothetical protein